MFDIGFFELLVIGIIALLVLGPERLPQAVRMTGAWIGKIRRATQAVRDELEREVNAQELQRRLKEEMEKTGLNEAKNSLDDLQTAMKKNLLEQESWSTPAPDAIQDSESDKLSDTGLSTESNKVPDTDPKGSLSLNKPASPATSTPSQPNSAAETTSAGQSNAGQASAELSTTPSAAQPSAAEQFDAAQREKSAPAQPKPSDQPATAESAHHEARPN